jgi:hypothetical protein
MRSKLRSKKTVVTVLAGRFDFSSNGLLIVVGTIILGALSAGKALPCSQENENENEN